MPKLSIQELIMAIFCYWYELNEALRVMTDNTIVKVSMIPSTMMQFQRIELYVPNARDHTTVLPGGQKIIHHEMIVCGQFRVRFMSKLFDISSIV